MAHSSFRHILALLIILGLELDPSLAVEEIDWFVQSYAPRTVLANETLRFTWSGTHNVFQFDDETAFLDCETDDATLLCSSAVNECEVFVGPGTFYFGCGIGSHCSNGGQRIQINVVNDLDDGGGVLDPLETLAVAVGSIAGAALLYVAYTRRGRARRFAGSVTESLPSPRKKTTPKWEVRKE